MISSSETVNAIAQLFCEATQEVVSSSTGQEVSYSQTMQMIPSIHLRPDIGCFVLFSGDYSGLMIMNFEGQAAVEIYRHSMLKMGMPEDELSTEHTADEVVNAIGELINQVIGMVRRRIEEQYQLVAHNTQPKAIALATAIILNIDSRDPASQELCRRLSFKINRKSFHIELSLERSEFVRFDGGDVHRPKHHQSNKEFQMENFAPQAAAPKGAGVDPFSAAHAATQFGAVATQDPFAAAQAATQEDPFAAAQAAAQEDPFAAAQKAAKAASPAKPASKASPATDGFDFEALQRQAKQEG